MYYRRKPIYIPIFAICVVVLYILIFRSPRCEPCDCSAGTKGRGSKSPEAEAYKTYRTDRNEGTSDVNVYTFDKGWKRNLTVCAGITLRSFPLTPLLSLNKLMAIYVFDPYKDLISYYLTKDYIFHRADYDIIDHFIGTKDDVDLIDIGANLGMHALQMAERGKKVFAVEIAKECVQRLCASTVYNTFQKQITILHNAIGSEHTDVRYVKSKGNWGFNFVESKHTSDVMRKDLGAGFFSNETVTYKSMVLDDILEHPEFKGVKKVFIKMDVEGFEHKVIQGADNFLNNVQIEGVYMEWNKQGPFPTGEIIIEKLKAKGFEPFDCGNFGDKKCRFLSDKSLRTNIYNVLWLPKRSSEIKERTIIR